ncbi:MAG: hypothetical protein QOD65_668 [Gaiellales bacterium]|jgi:hypothetical protein|nr:hypothetical protein [Gaiellales bacterium]MDX6597766.1 hypothetical protein [Gaiellales bacterium]
MPTALSLPCCVQVVADYEDRGYRFVRDTEFGVVVRHPNGGVVTVLANGETRAGDKAGPSADMPTAWWSEPAYMAPE